MIKEKLQELLSGQINFVDISSDDENYTYYEQCKITLKNNDIVPFNYKEIVNAIKVSSLIDEYTNLMKDIKTDLLYQSTTHGLNHNIRVSVFALLICIFENIKLEDFKMIIEASKYHDIGRTNDMEDDGHGFRSSQMLSFLSDKYSEEELTILKTVITCHSLSDDKFDLIANRNKIKNIERTRKIFYILKDADALDRVRLEYPLIKVDLIRTESAKKLILFAYELYFNYKKWMEVKSE